MAADEQQWLPSPCECFGGSCLKRCCPNRDRIYAVMREEKEDRAVPKAVRLKDLDYADPRRAR